jgi:electron transfer flavoprotein beta subunit
MAVSVPLVVALLRHTDLRPEVDRLTGQVSRDYRSAGANPAELAALETALRIAEAWGGRVLAVTAGPVSAEETLREAHAVGASVLRVPWPRRGAADEDAWIVDLADDGRSLAEALVAAVRTVGEPDLVLCGDRSADRGTGAIPAYVAHELGAAQALGLVSLSVEGPGLRALRRLDGGRREVLRVPRPAVCSVEAAGLRLRRASLSAELAARRSAVPFFSPPSMAGPSFSPAMIVGRPASHRPRARLVPPPTGADPRDRLLELTGALATRSAPTVLGPMPAEEAADVLLHWLAERGYAPVEAAS